MPNLTLRLFVEADASEASALAQRLRDGMQSVGAQASLRVVRRYWKIPDYQEVCMDLTVLASPEQAIVTVTSRLGSGWSLPRDGEAIWNPNDHSSFSEPLVRWAHVEMEE